MNYEEMLRTREGVATQRETLPFGTFYKKLIDKKYRNVVELKPQLTDSLTFCEALKADQEFAASNGSSGQLHYELHSDSSGIYEIEIEQGNYQTLSQLLQANPAAVAAKGFTDDFLTGIMDAATAIHSKGVYNLCFAPQTIFLRKNSSHPLLMCHGSFYKAIKDVASLYKGFEQFIAPEVLASEDSDERSDVYSIGHLIEYIYESGDMPIEVKMAVRKATASDPNDRYHSVADMKAAIAKRRGIKQSALTFIAALAIVAFCIALYFDMMPQKESIEFVTPAAEEQEADPFDASFDPDTELGIDPNDTSFYLNDDERREMEEYQAKSEDIFRKRFEKEADLVLSKVYNNERMSASEKSFVAASQTMTEELMRIQTQIATEAGIPEDKAGKIATQIITRLSQQKQAALDTNGYQRARPDEDE